MNDPVHLVVSEHVARITLDRPDRGNVLDMAMAEAFCAAVDSAVAEPSVRAILIASTGRMFSVGGDIGWFAAAGDGLSDALARLIERFNGALLRLVSCGLPVVSAVQGPVGGGGIGLALCADVVVASESMVLRGGYTTLGLSPDLGSSWFVTRRVGPARAREIFLLNGSWTATTCLQWGLVDRVCPHVEIGMQSLALAHELAQGASAAMARTRQLIDGALGRSLKQQLVLERSFMVEAGSTADAREGLQAFTQKRAPRFISR